MSKLNKDILFSLFEELQYDLKSLFSCLTVNRLWCKAVIPILWKNPWRYHDISYDKTNSLYNVIIFYLTDGIKEILTMQGIQLPQILYKSLLFDYLSFCQCININIINSIASFLSSSDFCEFLLKQEFYNILIRKGSKLKYLDMRSIEYQIFYFPEAKVHFESLYELICDVSINPSFFYGLTCICKNIQRLIIINEDVNENDGIIKLIEVQNNLKYFEWRDSPYDFNDNHDEYFEALVKKADTLNHLIVSFQVEDYEHVFLIDLLPELHKLKTLKINDFYLTSSDEGMLKTLVYHDLEVFSINCFTVEAAACIIENSRGHLREILFLQEPCDDIMNDDSLILIRKIYENCPLVEYLSLAFSPSEEDFTEFKKLLKVCRNLKSLLLIVGGKYEFYKSTREDLLEILVEFATINLRELRFYLIFSLEALETFLEKWKGRPALSMITSNPVYDQEDYVNLINKYKNVGVIKDFKYCCIYF